MRANHKPPNRSRPAGDSRVPGPREIHIFETPRRVEGGAHRRCRGRAAPNPSFFVVFLDTEKMVPANQGSNSPKKIMLFTVKMWPHVKKTFKKGCHPIITVVTAWHTIPWAFDMTDSSRRDLRCRSCSAMRAGRAPGVNDANRALRMTAMMSTNGRRAFICSFKNYLISPS
jgi:hypothetical protein